MHIEVPKKLEQFKEVNMASSEFLKIPNEHTPCHFEILVYWNVFIFNAY